MGEMPERVWLTAYGWPAEIAPRGDKTAEYIRADKHAEIVAALTRERDELRARAEKWKEAATTCFQVAGDSIMLLEAYNPGVHRTEFSPATAAMADALGYEMDRKP